MAEETDLMEEKAETEEKIEAEQKAKKRGRPKKEKIEKEAERHTEKNKEAEKHEHAKEERPIKPIIHVKPKHGVEILGKKENPLLNRQEIEVIIYHGGRPTPNRLSIQESAAHFLMASKDLLIVDRVYSKTGLAATGAKVLLYKNRQDMPKGKLEKMAKAEKKEGETAGAEKPAAPEEN